MLEKEEVMEHLAALLLIVGCSDDLSKCEELPAPTVAYHSMETCESDMQAAFGQFVRDYPQIFAQCVTFEPELLEMDAQIVWEITDAEHLLASVEPVGQGRQEIASRSIAGDSNPVLQ